MYAVDFFLLFLLLDGNSVETEETLARMGDYLEALLGEHGEIEFWGDDDGGRLFHPYGTRSRFGRATMATLGLQLGNNRWTGKRGDRVEQACWWLGADALRAAEGPGPVAIGPRLFRDSGMAFLQAGRFSLQMDCGRFGFGGAGHSHSDTLAVTLRLDGRPVLIDAGTYTYISDIEQRNWFRGSAAHNTVRVNGRDQAEPITPFRWAHQPEVQVLRCESRETGGTIEARCEYAGVRHTRRVWLTGEEVVVLDEIAGPADESSCEQNWHFGAEQGGLGLSTSAPMERRQSWFSPAYGRKVEGVAAVAETRGRPPIRMAARICLGEPRPITVEQASDYFVKGSRNLGESFTQP